MESAEGRPVSARPGAGRDAVLAQIRQSLGRRGPASVAPLAGSGPRPAFAGDSVERFAAKMLEKSATLERLPSFAEVGPAVARFVAALGSAPRVRIAAALADLEWPAGLEVLTGAAQREDATSVTPCFAAVAESGGIVTLSGPDTPSTLNFVPDNHIVVVRAAQVVPHFEDVWTQFRASGRPMPRTINIISGPSRTADIEQTIQLGAHGPRRLHILLLAA
jgi:L-lactate dehydrogenase complex protein LldG